MDKHEQPASSLADEPNNAESIGPTSFRPDALVAYQCPHCGGFLAVAVRPEPAAVETPTAGTSSAPAAPQSVAVQFVEGLMGRFFAGSFPISSGINEALVERQKQQSLSADANAVPKSKSVLHSMTRLFRRLNWRLKLFIAFPILVLVLILGDLLRPSGPSAQTLNSAAQASPPTPQKTGPVPDSAHESDILDTLALYNAAESAAGAQLSIQPLEPFLDPEGTLYARRAALLTKRAANHQVHFPRLVRWAVGTLTVSQTTAVVTTQETWENREQASTQTDRATVHVTYQLRYDADRQRWLIVEATVTRI